MGLDPMGSRSLRQRNIFIKSPTPESNIEHGEKEIGKKTDVLLLKEGNFGSVLSSVSTNLEKGKVCIIPTDTLYGMVALDHFGEAVRDIYRIKERPLDKPLIRLIGSIDSVKSYSSQELPASLAMLWPGPLTIVFKGKREQKVALRFPNDPFLSQLFRMINYRVMVAPSANISGQKNIYDNSTLIDTFYGRVDLIVCLEEGLKEKEASTIIDISEPVWRILRRGAMDLDPKEIDDRLKED